ncbi:MAG TPA: heterodisulfide reductase-related iron-sulfur binding cluster [Bryobacteraceae bacterium]|jgi:glycolate oxidase iron-sulfur subunit|nr:heterodisulfide reductase-related iron-sulfur binding cluster [Bryobacteraceae bacterium]
MVESEKADRAYAHGPRQFDLDKCVHCGLCLNACPTYRELGLEMDSPRGRVYQMVQVAEGAPITPSYVEHIDLCLACRGCESACPSGVRYGRMVEDARAQIEAHIRRGWLDRRIRRFVFGHLLDSRATLTVMGTLLYLYEASGMKALVRALGLLKLLGRLGDLEQLAPSAEPPFFFSQVGRTFLPQGPRRYRVAFLAGCIANIAFARLNEATVRVLQKNGCEVAVPKDQGCCGALHVHSGLPGEARKLARRNIDAVLDGGFEAIITNAAGCGSTLKEYGELLEDDPEYAAKAREFSSRMRDVTEFLAGIELNPQMGPVNAMVTYQDSCHLAHGQRVRTAPRKLLSAVPGVTFREMPGADICCGSAGIYNVVQNEMSSQILGHKMESVSTTGAGIIATANPGCILQLQAGVRARGTGQRVMHVVEILDLAYKNW